MTKRVLSLLLMLAMVLSFFAPAVRAADADQIYIGDGSELSYLVDSGVVSLGESPEDNNFGLQGLPTLERVEEEPSIEPNCSCGQLTAALQAHADSCALKQFCLSVGQGNPAQIAAEFEDCSADVRNALVAYLSAAMPEKLEQINALRTGEINDDKYVAPEPERLSGEASAVYEDVTVDAVGVPEGSSLTVAEPSAEAVEAVQDYVAQVDVVPEELFVYDISVQNSQSRDWQPEDTSVELTLALENLDLPKHSVVKILHVDDEGNVSVIETKVGDEGRIVFETEGFSTFAGFTVDFSYASAFHSIAGMTSITMSELFDALEMPLYASEVVDAAFSDETLVSVEQIEGDWLLTSLKAFDTRELLTFTMSDGRVFEINVTDAQDGTNLPDITVGGNKGQNDNDDNNYVEWKADGDGDLSNTNEEEKVGWSQTAEIRISGAGTFNIYINANPGSVSATTEELHVNIYKIRIMAGADLKFFLNGDVSTNAGDASSFGQPDYDHIKRVIVHSTADTDLFQVSNGSLRLLGLPGTRLVLDGADLNGNQKLGTGTTDNHLVYLGAESTGFIAKYVTFRNAPRNAIRARPSDFGTFEMQHCDFESSVHRETFGGAIYFMQSDGISGNPSYTTVDYFTLKDVDFNGNYAEQGGAIYLRGKFYCIDINKNCEFVNCEAKQKGGGAIYIDAAVGEATINASFNNCKAALSGGALTVASVICNDVPRVAEETGKTVKMTTRTNHLILDGARFENCKTLVTGSETEGMGGAVHLSAETHTVDILNCTFLDCSSANNKTNASGGAICFGYYNLADNFKAAAEGGDSYWTAAMTNSEKTEEWGEERRAHFYTWESTQSDGTVKKTNRTTFGTVNITDTTFTNCSAGFHGGAFMVRTGACITDLNCTNLTIDGCIAQDRGSAIFFNNCVVGTADFDDCVIKNCKITNPDSQFGGTMTTVGTTTMVLTVKNCQFLNNISYDSGGGLYWNAGNPRPIPEKKDTDERVMPKATVSNCLFQGNEATTHYGGGIFTECEMEIIACTFDGNKANIGGGICMGVYNNDYRMMRYDEKAELALDSDTSFYNNSATHGGAIAIRANATASLVNYPEYPYYDEQGNLVAPEIIHTVSFKLGGAQIYNNSATKNGGGIYYKAENTYNDPLDNLEVQHYSKKIIIDEGTIYNNVAGNNGGGIFMNSSENTYITVTDGVIYNNEAGVQYTTELDENNVPVKVQSANGGGNGGGIYLTGNHALVTISGGSIGFIPGATAEAADTVMPNIAHPVWSTWTDAGTGAEESGWLKGKGGAIAVCDGAQIEMTGGAISYNKAYNGGGIAVYTNTDTAVDCAPSSMDYSGGTISHNEAELRGGGIYVNNDGVMNLYGGLLTENKALATGGGVGACGGAQVLITKQTLDGKVVYPVISKNESQYGGGLSAVSEGTSITIEEGEISENKALTDPDEETVAAGGAIYCANHAYMAISGGTIDSNTSTDHGGAVFANTKASILIDGGIISGNTANWNGGGVFASGGAELSIDDGEITSNTAKKLGGGIAAFGDTTNGGAKLTISGGAITMNDAEINGGGLYLCGAEEDVVIPGTDWDELDETEENADQPTEPEEEGTGETVDEEAFASAEVLITGGEISGNEAVQNGAGIYISKKAQLTIEDVLIKNNTALRTNGEGGYGGGMYTGGESTTTIKGGEFIENTANYRGGGVYGAGSSTVYLDGGFIQYNTAKQDESGYGGDGGGLVATSSVQLYVRGTEITHNIAQGNGGGIFAGSDEGHNPKIWISRHASNNTVGMITHNTAHKSGGGVFVGVGGELYVSEGHITYNQAIGNETTRTTGRYDYDTLGVGGGICVAGYDIMTDGVLDETLSLPATFELAGGTGKDLAIYGNLASFAGDDVYSNGIRTKLTIPNVQDMNLSGYDFKPEGWFEDYAYHDTSYAEGLNLGASQGITKDTVTRYRGSVASNRVLIDPEYLDDKVGAQGAYVAMTLGIPGAVDDTVVVDHFLPVKIDLMQNDLMITEQEFANSANLGLVWPELSVKDGIYYGETKDQNYQYTQLSRDAGQLSFGDAVLNGHEITFTMLDPRMTAEDSFYYVVGHDSPDPDAAYDYYHYAKVTIIPATTIYYEDNSGMVSYSANWTPVDCVISTNPDETTDLSNKYQDQDRPGEAQIPSIDADNLYGNDSNYKYAAQYSMDSAMKVRVSEGVDATATFTFTGTGFDIIGLTSNNTGAVLADLYKGDSVNGEYIDTVMVDTYYGCTTNYYKVTRTYKNGAWVITAQEQIAASDMGTSAAEPTNPAEGTTYVAYETRMEAEACTGYLTRYYQLTHSYNGDQWSTAEKVIDPSAFGTDEAMPSNPSKGAVYHTYEARLEVDPTFTAEPEYVDGEVRSKVAYFKQTHTMTNGSWVTTEEEIQQWQMAPDQIRPAVAAAGDTYVTYTQRMVAGTGDTLYQVPVLKRSGLEYDTYTVQLYVAWSWWTEAGRPAYEWCDFYLDGIRIYDPANNGVIDGVTNQVIQNAYQADHEGWPVYEEIRNLLIEADQLSVSGMESTINGVVFIDGNTALGTDNSIGTTPEGSAVTGKKPQVVDYANYGPNNEVYLAPGQGISFKLDLGAADLDDVEIASVQVAIRATALSNGASCAFKLYENPAYMLDNAPLYTTQSCTETYYDITHADGNNVVIYADPSSSCPIAVSNLKVTFTGNPYQTDSGNMGDDTGTGISVAKQIVEVNSEIAQQVLASMMSEGETVPVLTPRYPSLSFEGEICYNVYFDAENMGNLTTADLGLAVFTCEDSEGTVDTADSVIWGAVEKNGLYMLSTDGIAAKDMGDRVWFRIVAKLSDGSCVYSVMRNYCALDYAENVLDSDAAPVLKSLVVAMLNYGAEAQRFFSYRTDSLMNAGLTLDQQALLNDFDLSDLADVKAVDITKTAAFASAGGFTSKYPSVTFDGAFRIGYYFVPEYEVDGDVTLCFWNEDTYNSVAELTVDNADYVRTAELIGSTYFVSSENIVAKDMDKTVYVAAAYESNGNALCSGILPYSIASYCKSPSADVQSLATAAGIYGSVAKTYFGS